MSHSINQDILKLWKETFQAKEDVPSPIFHMKFEHKNPILFIGINPSLSEDYMSKTYQDIQLNLSNINLDNKTIYQWATFNNDFINLMAKVDSLAKQRIKKDETITTKHPFFRRHQEIADYLDAKGLKSDWEHIDLFQYRITKQN